MLDSYTQFMHENPDVAKSLPALLPVLVSLLPIRRDSNGGAEVMAEAGYALSNLWAHLHDHLLHRCRGEEDATGMADLAKAPIHIKARVLLTVIACTELLIEKWARQYGTDSGARRLIVLLECIKLVLRLVVLAKSEGGMLISGGRYLLSSSTTTDPDSPLLTPHEAQDDEASPSRVGGDGDSGLGGGSRRLLWGAPSASNYVETRGRRTGRRFLTCRQMPSNEQQEQGGDSREAAETALPPASSIMQPTERGDNDGDEPEGGGILEEEEPRAVGGQVSSRDGGAAAPVVAPEMMEEDEATKRLRRLKAAGEILRLVRPLIQATWGGSSGEGSGSSSWKPLLLSLLVDIASLSCSAEAMEGGGGSSHANRRELERRRLLLLLYFLRPPVFRTTTEPFLSGLVSAGSKLPLVGWLGGYVLSSVEYVQKYHFYTVGS